MSETVTLSIVEAEAFIVRALIANRVPDVAASSVARGLVAAEAEGQTGHGFSRVADYIGQVRTGKIIADAVPSTRKTAPSTLRTDAGHGFAYPALDQAIECGCALAAEMGVASVAVAHSHHCGALSLPVRQIAEKGMVGLMMANAPAAIAPWGGHVPLYGTNPIAFAAPRPVGDPLIVDLSLSRVARGKVMHAHKTGQTIPEGWALDPDGNPTTDPEQGLAGTMVPIGEAKGTALALIVEVFASLMTGSSMSKDVSSFFTADGPPPDVGQFLLIFRPPEGADFGARLDALLSLIEQQDGARVPGARRAALARQAAANGVAVPKAYIDGIEQLAVEGVVSQ
ncbi:MAG: Ldh family oxidoreductase [Pseudomonadota bacterium]